MVDYQLCIDCVKSYLVLSPLYNSSLSPSQLEKFFRVRGEGEEIRENFPLQGKETAEACILSLKKNLRSCHNRKPEQLGVYEPGFVETIFRSNLGHYRDNINLHLLL